MSQEKNRTWCSTDALFVVAAGGFALAVALIYVAHEQPVYVWDFKMYWSFFQQYGDWFRHDPLPAVKHAIQQIRSADYHPLSIAPLIPAQLIFGEGRAAYIGSTSLLYLFPCCVLFSLLVAKAEQAETRRMAGWLALCLALAYVSFWRPTLRGLPDIVGLLPILGATLLVFTHDFSARLSVKRAIALGALLWLPFLLRRWYAYSIICLYLTLPLLSLALGKMHGMGHRLRFVALNFFVAGVASLGFALIVQWPLIVRVLQTDYSFFYSTYQFGRGAAVMQLLTEIGLYTIPLYVAGVVRALWQRGPVRYLVWFSVANLVMAFALFTGTQSPGIHHNLPFALWYLVVVVLGVVGILQYLPGKLRTAGAAGVAALSVFVLFASQYGETSSAMHVSRQYGPNASAKDVATIMPEPFPPFGFAQYDHYQRLVADLDQLVGPDEKFSVLGSSLFLNDDLMLTLSQNRLQERLVPTPHSDLQNGLRPELMHARYLVIGDPVQIHMASGQDGIVYPAKEILAGRSFGSAYERVGPGYALDQGVTAYIYRRVRPFTAAEAAQYVDHYFEQYPDWKDVHPRQEVIDSLTGTAPSVGDGR